METKFLQTMKQFVFRGSGAKTHLFRSMVTLLALSALSIGDAWAGASTTMRTISTNTAQGLVYMTSGTTNAPALNAYKATSDDVEQSTSSGGVANFIAWAKPARGYKFSTWADANGKYTASDWPKANSSNTTQLNTDPSKWDGVHDTIQGGNGGQASTDYNIRAYFVAADAYDITYAVPVGGSYSIRYKYFIINASTAFEEKTDDYSMTSASEEDLLKTSYAADEITLTVPNEATNFIGWYEGSTLKSTNKTYEYTAHANVTIKAEFKELAWGEAFGDLTTNVTATGTYGGKTVYVAIPTLIGSWETSDFTVAPMSSSNESGSIALGTVALDKTNNRLVIPYTYTASGWGGIEATFTITPSFGAAKQFSVACSAEEVVDYEACIEENGVRTYTGTLADMMTQANSMNNQPVLKLMQNKTITAPLSFTNSFTFDVNGKVLTASCASAFSIDAADKDVKIIDGSFTQVGEIHTSSASSGVVSVVTFTQAAKLTMQGGTLSATNTGSGSAYGVNVSNGSIFYMTNGLLTVTGVSEARGVNVATASDYATLNGGSVTVSSPAGAYGVWSAGQSNITNATIAVETTTGANAYGVYVNGGVSTLTTNTVTAGAKTTGAYGAYVNAGRLNVNGGSFAVEAVTSGVYGVHVQAGAAAMLQQNATVTAEATGVSGTNVVGINNLGTASLTNITVTATSPTTAATAVNTAASAVSTTIDGGTYRANAAGGTAYGLHHQYGALNADGGTFRAVGSGNTVYGALVSTDATIANATLYGETQGEGNTAYGFKGDVANKNISLSDCAITGKSNTSKAYAVYSNTNVTATGCTLTATTTKADEAYGVYAANGTNRFVNCDATVSVYSITAYGVKHVAGSLTIDGGQYDVTANQTSATAAQNSVLYGLHNESGQTTTVNGAAFNVNAANTAYSQYVYGALINGTLVSTNGGYTARGKNYVYGIYGNSSSTLTLSGNNVGSTITDGTVSYGIYAKKNFTINGDIVNAVGNKTGVYAMFFDANNSVGEVLDGKFSAQGNGTNDYGPLNATGTAGKVKLKGGVAKTAANLKKYAYTGYDVYTLDNTHADYAAGYRYTIATENPSPYVCYIKNGNKYETLAAALQYTKDNSGTYTIIMTQNHTLPAGDYELPSSVTLIVPRNSSQTTLNTTVPKDATPVVEMLEEHLRLTLASGAHLNVDGKIEVGGKMYSQESGKISYNNSPYGRIHMESGSLIQLNNGARLYAWGFISGSGEIKAKSGAICYEMFQVGDMPAISPLGQYYLDNSAKYFPVQTYSIQNIEVPTTYYYNSQLYTPMYEYNPGSLSHGWNGQENIKLIGKSDALFLVTTNDESSWVRKSYVGGKQIYEINSAAKLGSLSIAVSSYEMNSLNYILPITATMKIHILDGTMEITQSTMFQPGTQVEIDKTATLKINSKDANNRDVSVYVIDQDQWRTTTSNPDAAWNVHGKVEVVGKLYTTNKGETTKTDGANIYSTNADAGTVSFYSAAGSDETFRLVTGASGGLQTKTVNIESAKLKNSDNSYTATAGTTSGEAWIYLNGTWQKTYTNGCFEVVGTTVYAKPSGYVALKKSQTDANSKLTGVEESDHTYLTAADKILILMDECQWWEVEATSDPTVFECKKEGYEGFYYYDNSSSKWILKTVNVKFYSAETGDNVLKTIVTDYNGIPDQAVISSNPDKATTTGYTYTFYGWKSSVTGTEYKWTDPLEVATADMSYRPVFTATKRNYTITLNDANNGETVYLEVPYETMPSYEATKEASAEYTYSFDSWSPALVAVTGPATYTAQWSSIKNRYTITWVDGETTLEEDKNQLYGTATAYNGALPTKDADNSFVYAFSGWLSSLTGTAYANGSTPAVGGATTYTAQYSTTPRYMVTFANYDGGQLQKEAVTEGEHPVYNGVTPARARDLDGYYIFTGWLNSNGDFFALNATLPVVTAKETYTAQYSYTNDLFLITLNNVDGNGATWSGKFGEGSTPFYNPDNNDIPVIPAKEGNAQYEYEFTGWDPVMVPVTAAATYTAQFEQHTKTYTITFANVDGNGTQQTVEAEYGSTPACPVVPAKSDNYYTYDFLGWDNTIVAVTGEATYTAQFSGTGTPRTFTITFEPENGGTAQVLNVAYGQTPAPTAPVKASDAQYTYTFAGWYPELASVTEDATYYAQYTQTLNSYTIRFVNYDGTELQSSPLNYGVTPAYSGATPAKPVDMANRKAYTFNGWSPAVASVTGNATYTATFSETTFVASVTPAGGEPSYYSTWASALSAAKASANNTLKLYDDISAPNNNEINKNMTIDLNGCTISFSGSQNGNTRLFYVNGVALTIEDSKGGGVMSYRNTRTGSNSQAYTIYVNGTASVTINGGTIKAERTSGNYVSAAVYLYSGNSTLNLNGGELIATENSGGSGYAVAHRGTNYGYSNIRGGKLKGKSAVFQNPATGRVSLSGGYYSKDPGTSVTIASGYGKLQITSAEQDPEYSNGYTYKVVHVYTITYDKGANGSGTIAAGTKYEGVDFTLSSSKFTREGYTQTGWSATDGGAKTYEPGGTYTEDAALTVYPFWEINVHTLAWNANSGELDGSRTEGDVEYGTAIVAPTATRTGYTFAGWHDGTSVVTPTTMPDNNVTYTAQWTPNTNTAYTVEHYQQNIENDGYTLFETENLTGTTAENVTPAVKSYEGFTAPATQTEAVAADGSLVIEYRYTRNSSTLAWETDGDALTGAYTNGSVKFGTTIAAPATPTKTGYTFAGWHNGTSVVTPTTMPDNNVTYTAQWTPNTNTAYTVEHYQQNIENDGYTLFETENLTGTTAENVTPAVKSYTGFTAPATQTEAIAADGSLVIEYRYTRNSYLLTWNLDGGKVTTAGTAAAVNETAPSANVKYEAAVTVPIVERVGYTFNGWNATVEATMPAEAIGYIAQWTPNTNTAYTVKHYKQQLDGTYSVTPDDTDNLTGTTAANVTPEVKSYEGFSAPATQTEAIAADGSLVIVYQYTRNSHNLTWNAGDGALSGEYTYGSTLYGTTITAPTVTRDGYRFTGWSDGTSMVEPAATMPDNDLEYTATYARILPDKIVSSAESITESSDVNNLTITATGQLNVPSGKILTTTDLILQGTTTTSGQLFTVDDNVTVTGNAYYDLTLDAQRRTWYGVAVPWRVSAQDGVYGDGKRLVLGKDFDIVWYDGEVRAAMGPVAECYKYLEDIGEPANRIIEPGRMYFMFFARPYNVIRFQKKAGESLVNYTVPTDRYKDGAGDITDKGWNGIANPGLTHVTIPEATPNRGYRYKNVNMDENKTGQWQLITDISAETFVVGQPIMVQLPADGGIKLTMSPVAYAAAPAPVRKMAANGDIDRAEVLLTSQNGATDRILCMVDDEAVDEYTIGQDLVKFTNDDVPQLWIRNYKHALAVNTVRAENNTATYPLTIVSPKAGDYTLSLVNKLADGIHLYLTLNGEAIADLTEGEYTLPMGKETNKAYGLRLVRGPRGTVTGVDEALDGKDNAEKVIMNGMLFIIRQGKMYDAQGRLIEN